MTALPMVSARMVPASARPVTLAPTAHVSHAPTTAPCMATVCVLSVCVRWVGLASTVPPRHVPETALIVVDVLRVLVSAQVGSWARHVRHACVPTDAHAMDGVMVWWASVNVTLVTEALTALSPLALTVRMEVNAVTMVVPKMSWPPACAKLDLKVPRAQRSHVTHLVPATEASAEVVIASVPRVSLAWNAVLRSTSA